MILRPAVPEDRDAIAALLTQLGYPADGAFAAGKIARLSAHPDALLLVAEKDARVLGFIALHFIPQLGLPGDFCRIAYFCVDEAARGAGVGAALEAAAVREAEARGCDRIEVHSSARRVRAHGFYFRQGFEESPKYLIKRLCDRARPAA